MAVRGAYSLPLNEAIDAFTAIAETAPTGELRTRLLAIARELRGAKEAGADPNLRARDVYREEGEEINASGGAAAAPEQASASTAAASPTEDGPISGDPFAGYTPHEGRAIMEFSAAWNIAPSNYAKVGRALIESRDLVDFSDKFRELQSEICGAKAVLDLGGHYLDLPFLNELDAKTAMEAVQRYHFLKEGIEKGLAEKVARVEAAWEYLRTWVLCERLARGEIMIEPGKDAA